MAATVACGSSDDDAGPGTAPLTVAGGSGTAGTGASAAGATGSSSASGAGGTAASVPGKGGSAGKSSAAGAPASLGGTTSTLGGSGGTSSSGRAGQGTTTGPPAAQADGSSPYERECHGDTVMCEDVAALRCLGIRDDTTTFGYSCSNPCEDDSECSNAPSSGDAKAACIDFVTQKHCLLLCSSPGATASCPSGMDCYVYPSSTVGYCLWQ
jgi:hypothetical protein